MESFCYSFVVEEGVGQTGQKTILTVMLLTRKLTTARKKNLMKRSVLSGGYQNNMLFRVSGSMRGHSRRWHEF